MKALVRAAFVLPWILFADSAAAGVTAIKAGHLIDPETGIVTTNKIILIDGKKIVDVVDALPSTPPETVIDLSDQWVLPGLMDLHTHLTFDYEVGLAEAYAKDGTGYRALVGVHNGEDMLQAGFTLVRDVGNAGNYADTDMRRAFEAGLFNGPTVYNSGKIIAAFGGQADQVTPEAGEIWHFEYIDADGPEEMRKAVRENLFYGAKLIKIVNDVRFGNHAIYTQEEIQVAADEAHRAGVTLAVHAKDDATAIPAILAGADSIEHGYELSDTALKLMKQKGTYLVGTDMPLLGAGPFSDKQKKRVDMKLDRLKRAWKIGVPMAFGTDTTANLPGETRGQSEFDYLEMWTRAGIPNAYIIKAMTFNGAKLLHIADQRGLIAKDHFADIVAVPADPLADIQALRKIDFVMKEGKVIPLKP
ncbi:MAG: amidohydrolase family protein [Asticcacaulis sp.]|uniref:amidohydrolase family protein n=1 Tax=Asticcacaulis sp. TaxID=1872648 RepID=UPI0039E5F5DA